MKDEKPATPEKRQLSHRLYDRMGLDFSLKAVNVFIAVVVILLVAAIIAGVFWM